MNLISALLGDLRVMLLSGNTDVNVWWLIIEVNVWLGSFKLMLWVTMLLVGNFLICFLWQFQVNGFLVATCIEWYIKLTTWVII